MKEKGPNVVIRARAQDGGVPTLRTSLGAQQPSGLSPYGQYLFLTKRFPLLEKIARENMGHRLRKIRTSC